MAKIKKLTLIVTAVAAAVAGWVGSSGGIAYATTGASSGQGVATSLSDKWVKISTNGNIAMSVVPIADTGSLVAAKGTVNVQTNSGSGYQLYIAGSLYNTGDTDHWANLYKNSNIANPSIASTTATATATALAVNEWGYAVPSVTGNGYATADLYEAVIASEAITSTTTMNQLTWKGIKGDYQHVLSSTNTDATMATTGEDTDIYYGTRVNNTTDNGNYANVLVYTAFIDGGTSVAMTPTVLPITDQGDTTTVTFETGHESSSQPVTPSQISVELFNSSDADATIATCDPSTIQIITGHDGTSGQPLQFTCTVTRDLATSDNNGTLYDVIVRVDKENNGLYMTYEHQDYWRFTTTWTYNLSFNGNGATSGVPATQTGTLSETSDFSYTLPANPTRTNYSFNNWSDGTNTYVAGNTITLTKANPTKTLTAQWSEIPVTYTLNYAAGDHAFSNASSFSTPQTATQNMSTGTSYTFTISSTTPTTADDYTFDHWTDGTNSYAPGATITLQSTGNTVTLTAVWKANKAYMQDASTATACKALATNGTMVAYDRRDEKGYLIGKLADGKCWMLQNLALAGGTTITSTDSNVSSNYTLPSSSTSGWDYDTAQYMYNDTTNTGAYYSFLTATANTGTGSSGNASSSICPKGWRLPTSTSSGEFQALYTAVGGTTSTFNTAFKVAFTGICVSGSCPANVGSYAYYWSSTISSSTHGYILSTSSSNTTSGGTYPSIDDAKRFGYSVRCVLAS